MNIRTAFSSKRTLRHELVRVKERVESLNIKGVVYKVDCECGHTYIGETGQSLSVRIKEHKRAVQSGDTNNGISLDANTTMHSIKWKDAKILEIENNWLKKKI